MKRLLATIVVGLAAIPGIVQGAESRPKLVVGIVVDQLRTDYLENLRDMLSSGGFRRLMDQSLYFKDLDFIVPEGDATSASAIIQTGTFPRQNGVTGALVYDPQSKSMKPIFTDNSFIGNFTNETYSPSALRVSTLTDELSIEESGKTRIYSITPDAGQAIVLAGHTGNSAFWINDETGRWSSSTFFTGTPEILQNKNYTNPLISRLDTIQWTPLKKNEPYPYVSAQEIKDGFKYTFSRSDRDVFELYKRSPFINRDITEAAIDYINELHLGKNKEGTDVLNIGYTLSPSPAAGDTHYRYELEDAYLRLDKDLEELLNTLDREVGRDNVLVYLVSSGYFTSPAIDNKQFRLSSGTFSVKRALSLLNAFLSAKYGNAAYVDQYANGQIYLSKQVLEEKNLSIETVAEEGRDFLVKMSGISEAYTPGDLISPAIRQLEARRLTIDPKTSGEIILEFTPGWTVVDDSRFPTVTQENKSSAFLTPGFIAVPGMKAQVIEEPVEATAIAPTLAASLRIRAPNAAVSKPLPLKK